MAEFQKKRDSKNIWHSPLVLFIMLCLVLWFAYNMIGLVEKVRDSAKERAVVESQISDLNASQTSLQNNINKLQTDAGTEETLRDKYQMVKPGEQMVMIVDPAPSSDSTPPSPPSQTSGFWAFLKGLFHKS